MEVTLILDSKSIIATCNVNKEIPLQSAWVKVQNISTINFICDLAKVSLLVVSASSNFKICFLIILCEVPFVYRFYLKSQ